MLLLVHLGVADHQGDSLDGTLNGHCFFLGSVIVMELVCVTIENLKKHSFQDGSMFKSLEISVKFLLLFLWETMDYTSVPSPNIFPLSNLKMCFVAKKQMQEKIPEISGPTTQSTSLLFLQQLSSQ